jgi:hypothetical protein
MKKRGVASPQPGRRAGAHLRRAGVARREVREVMQKRASYHPYNNRR